MKKIILSLIFMTTLLLTPEIMSAKENTFQSDYLNATEINFFDSNGTDITDYFENQYSNLFQTSDFEQITNILIENEYYYSYTPKPIKTLEKLNSSIISPYAIVYKSTSKVFSFPFRFYFTDVNGDGVINSLDGGTFKIEHQGRYRYDTNNLMSASSMSMYVNPYVVAAPEILSNTFITYNLKADYQTTVSNIEISGGIRYFGTSKPNIYDHLADRTVLGTVSYKYEDIYSAISQ